MSEPMETGKVHAEALEAKLGAGALEAKVQAAALEAAEGVAASIYRRVYHVLVVGMAVSTTLFATGLLRALVAHEQVPLSTRWIRAQYNWDLFVSGLGHLHPTSLLMAATFVLILTPIFRVGVSIVAFAMEGDRKFVAITSTVMGIILCTVVLARIGWVSPEHVAIKPAAKSEQKLAKLPAPTQQAPAAPVQEKLANVPAP